MAAMVTGGLFNAFAFAGAGFLFNKLNHSGYKDEIKRHNLALEQLSRDKQQWYQEEVERKNEIQLKRQQLADASADINETNKALVSLSRALKSQINKLELTGRSEHMLSDYYKPSKEMEEYQMVAMAIAGLGGGFVGYKAYKAYKAIRTKWGK